ncbi:MAG: hypothetical protein WBR29_07920 [Gammaproteobacteria bacterium]
MPNIPASTHLSISETSLQLAATLLGLVGTALVLVQALVWLPSGHANLTVLIFTAFVPMIAAIFFALAPRRAEQPIAQSYALQAPRVLITVGLPLLLSMLVIVLIGMSGNFNNFAGLVLLLAANTGRNLRDFVHSLRLHSIKIQS